MTISGCFAVDPGSSPAGFVMNASIRVPSKLGNRERLGGAERPLRKDRRI
jgi:hypothetical protein